MRKAAGTKRSKASKPRLAVAGKRRAPRRAEPSPASQSAAAPEAAVERIALPAACTLREAAALKSLLSSSTCTGGTVDIEGGAVARIDTAGLQLLAAFALREKAAGRQLQWHAASDELRAACARIGGTNGSVDAVLCAVDAEDDPAWTLIKDASGRQAQAARIVLCSAPGPAVLELAARQGAQILSRPPPPSKLRSLLAQRPLQALRGAA